MKISFFWFFRPKNDPKTPKKSIFQKNNFKNSAKKVPRLKNGADSEFSTHFNPRKWKKTQKQHFIGLKSEKYIFLKSIELRPFSKNFLPIKKNRFYGQKMKSLIIGENPKPIRIRFWPYCHRLWFEVSISVLGQR